MSNAIDLTIDVDSPPRALPIPLLLPMGEARPPTTSTASDTTGHSMSSTRQGHDTPSQISFLDTVMSHIPQTSNADHFGTPDSQGGSSSILRLDQPPRHREQFESRPSGALLRGNRPVTSARAGTGLASTSRPAPSNRRLPRTVRRGADSNRAGSTAPLSSSSAATASVSATAATASSRRSVMRDPTDDGFELTGMSEGARQAAERARREAEESQRWRQDFLSANARTIPGSYGAGPSHGTRNQVAHPSEPLANPSVHNRAPSVRLHDHLPPGPHQARTGPLSMMAGGVDHLLGDWLTGGRGRLDLNGLTTLLRTREHATGRGGAIGRGGAHRHRGHAHPSVYLPSRHDFKMVLNHRERQVKVGFSFGIVEPPVDVETYEDDPKMIAGALPDTSPICAGCDCALVLGGEGKRRMWALPCGHVVDGRCYERYCVGINADTAKQMAQAEVEADRQKAEEEAKATSKGKGPLNTLKRDQPEDPESSSTEDEGDVIEFGTLKSDNPDRVTDTKGKDRAISPAFSASMAATPSRDLGSKTTTRTLRQRGIQQEGEGSQTAFAHQAPKQVSVPKNVSKHDSSKNRKTKSAGPVIATADMGRRMANFKCPVEGCHQRIATASGKPSSALELYI